MWNKWNIAQIHEELAAREAERSNAQRVGLGHVHELITCHWTTLLNELNKAREAHLDEHAAKTAKPAHSGIKD